METADKIVLTPRNVYNDKPNQDQRMKTVTVDTFGIDYPEPKRS